MAFNGDLQFAKARSPLFGYNKTYLIWAAELGRISQVEFLLECDADVNAQDIFGATATHYAVGNNNFKMVNLLVKNGANLRLQDKKGRTALMAADTSGFLNIRECLQAAQADRS